MTRQRFADQRQGADIDLFRRIIAGRGVFQPAVAPELLHESAASGIDVMVIDVLAMPSGPGLQLRGQCAVAFLEKRPMQKAAIEHRSISGKLRFLFGHEGLVGTAKVLRLHADRLCERLRLDRGIEWHREFMM